MQSWTRPHISDDDWQKDHAPINSAASYALAIATLRAMYLAGEPIDSAEYGPRSVVTEVR